MLQPSDWEKVSSYSNMPALPPGGYVCEIKKVEEKTSKNTGKTVLHVSIDIAEGEYYEHYTKQWRLDSRLDKKWRGMAYVATQDKDGNTLPNFKGFIESVEYSNEEWTPAWSDNSEVFCASFVGKKVGVIFGREQFRSDRNGKLYWQTKARYFCEVDQIRDEDFTVPEDKYLDEEIQKKNDSINRSAEAAGFTVLEDDEGLPF